MRPLWRWLLGAALLLAAGAGHVLYWHAPRAIEGRPEADSEVARWLNAADLPISLWIPRPHQNLGRLWQHLGEAAGDGDWAGALARFLELPTSGLPSFGPFAVPPSSEICLAMDDSGERVAVSARVYPLLATFARLGGRLANNPWLAGGRVSRAGRRYDVSWHGRVWHVRTPGVQDRVEERALPSGSGLALLRLRQELEPMPPGTYLLRQAGSGVELTTSSAAPVLALEEAEEPQRELFLLVLSGGRELPRAAAQAMAFFALDGPDSNELPRAVLASGEGPLRWELPGGALLQLAGRRPRQAEVAGWRLAALDGTSLERGGELAPGLTPLLFDPAGQPLRWGMWLNLERAIQEASRVGRMLSEMPLAPPAEVRRWRDAITLIEPIAARYSTLTLVVTDEPRGARLRLVEAADE